MAEPTPTPTAPPGLSDARKVADLQALLEVSCQLSGSTQLGPLLSAIERASLHVLDCERTTIFLHDPDTDELYSELATGQAQIRFPVTRGIAGEAFRTGQIINVPDAYADSRFNQEVDRRTGYRTRNLLASPLLGLDHNPVGVIQVLNKRLCSFDAWDEELVRTFGSQAGVALQRQRLLDQLERRRNLERELSIARDIQMGLLPKAAPRVSRYDIAGWNQPADETGGDFYDFQELTGGALAVTIADVTGHGIGPALIASECRALLRASLSLTQNLERVLVLVNDLLLGDLPEGRFVTAFVGILRPEEDRFAYISAGHGPLLHFCAATGQTNELPTSGLPLGVLARRSYELSREIVMTPGDLLVFLTDGFVEWPNAAEERFGVPRLMSVLAEHHRRPSAAIIEAIHRAAQEFAAGTGQEDDLTAVVIKRV